MIAPIQRALVEENYETPTPIQAQTIPAALQGHDILGCAQTGTGKTAALALPILNHLGKNNRKATPHRPLALVLAPTRELAIQIGDSFDAYGRHLKLRQLLVYGGVSQKNQVKGLSRGAHILVATPGRLLDLINQGEIHLNQLEIFVLDEADRMLDMGFLPDLKKIISHLPEKRQSLFFSATLAPKIQELAKRLLKNPVSVNVTPKQTSVEKIQQQLIYVERNGKQPMLQKILADSAVDRALVFMRTKRTANMLSKRLTQTGIRSVAIHGNKSQAARQQALEAFRSRKVQVLVATDVAARGIDIEGITHVINFDLPVEPEAYVHRIGRTGRAGAEGIAISFCSDSERRELRAIEKLIGQKVPVSKEHRLPKSMKTKKEAEIEPNSRQRNNDKNQRSTTENETGSRKRYQRSRAARAAAKAAASRPQQEPKRTKWRRLKSRAKQTS
nr:DEAD/DEAH box helicase [Gimesia panareensis]